MRYILLFYIFFLINRCNTQDVPPTLILKIRVEDFHNHKTIDSVEISRYSSIDQTSRATQLYTNNKGVLNDTVYFWNPLICEETLKTWYYLDDYIIISKSGYVSDTILIHDFRGIDPVDYYNSLGDTTILIDLKTIYMKRKKD